MKKVLKWVGIIALVAVPIAILLKKKKDAEASAPQPDEADLYATDFPD